MNTTYLHYESKAIGNVRMNNNTYNEYLYVLYLSAMEKIIFVTVKQNND